MSAAVVFTFNDADDRDRASDGVSRYGAYLRQHADRFAGWDGAPVTGEAAEFAAAAWQVATSPVMSPPYLDWTAERVQSVSFTHSQDGAALIARVMVATPRPAALANLVGFADWDGGDRWNRGYHTPADDTLTRRPALLPGVVLLFGIDAGELYVPTDAPACLTVADAKASLRRLAALLDARVAPVLAALDPAEVARW